MKRSHSLLSCASSSSLSSCIQSPANSSSPPPSNKPKKPTKVTNKINRVKKTVLCKSPSKRISHVTPKTRTTKRSSDYRGVTRHRYTGRYEAHLWDKSNWNSTQKKKGRQIYLGAYDKEDAAARTYDLAALKFWGATAALNFPIATYENEIEEMEKMTKEEYMGILRRKSSGFSRGVSKYRGVARHHHYGRWESRIGRVSGNKYLYLGTFGTEEEAAEAYDIAAIQYRGPYAITNFGKSRYKAQLDEYQRRMEQQNPHPCTSSSTEAISQTEHLQQHHQELDTDSIDMLQQLDTESIDTQQQVIDEMEVTDVIDTQEQQLMVEVPYEESELSMALDNEYPWNGLCIDSFGFNDSAPFYDIPFDDYIKLPELFADFGLEDEIDYLLDSPVAETQDYVSSGFGSTLQAESSREEQEEAAKSPSSPLSFASVCTKDLSSFKA